ncbi:MAG TPA: cytochrome c biogenesis protein CcsA [Bacteroidales bacterium]|nr:cytochrome c biogenesis protein CcsA [Bacteroidales bacterium]
MRAQFKYYWWKVLAGILLLYAVIGGFFITVSFEGMEVAAESMRNLFYHVGMWFGMLTMLITGFVYSLRYLQKFDEQEDIRAVEAVNVGLMFGFLGIFTGMIWANFTWGSPWVKDPKLNGAAVGLLIYLAYAILRGSIDDTHKRAKVAAIYNIFAFFLWIVLVIILPRLAGESIHPAGGNNANTVLPMHLPPSMRLVFYPAMLGWVLLGVWIYKLRVRLRRIKLIIDNK